MRAIVQRHHGTADRLRKAEIDRPGIRAGEVLVEVRAASLDRGTWHLDALQNSQAAWPESITVCQQDRGSTPTPDHLPVTEVLCEFGSICSSQLGTPATMLGTGFGDRPRGLRATLESFRGNKKGHLLAFYRAL